MRINFGRVAASLAVVAALGAMIGCDKNNRQEYYEQREYREPAKPYPVTEDKDKGLKYAVLQHGAVMGDNIVGWRALSPELFKTLSGIEIKAPEIDKTYHPGHSYTVPLIEAGKGIPEHKMARINAVGLVPKELHGWAAVEQATLESMSKKFFEDSKK